MRRVSLTVLVVLAALAAPGAAGAQLFAPGARIVDLSLTNIDATVHGTLTVSFHGDAATGCAAKGLCAYSGVLVLRPAGGAQLEIDKLRENSRIAYTADLSTDASLAASVSREVGGVATGTCADSSSPADVELPVHGSTVTFRVISASTTVLATRCAGPLDADVARAIPATSMSARAAALGRRVVDLSGVRDFAGGGFAGTVRSSLTLRLGHPSSETPSMSGSHAPMRVVRVPLKLVRLDGGVSATVQGVDTPDVCSVLDSCGARATLKLISQPRAAQGDLIATGPAQRPYRDFLAALGLSRTGRSKGIGVFGSILWDDTGTFQWNFAQPTACADGGGLGTSGLFLAPHRGRLSADYVVASSFRARCPGPLVTPAVPAESLASGSIALQLGREFMIHLRSSGQIEDDGYTGRFRGGLVATVRRGRITQQIFRGNQTIPAGAGLGVTFVSGGRFQKIALR